MVGERIRKPDTPHRVRSHPKKELLPLYQGDDAVDDVCAGVGSDLRGARGQCCSKCGRIVGNAVTLCAEILNVNYILQLGSDRTRGGARARLKEGVRSRLLLGSRVGGCAKILVLSGRGIRSEVLRALRAGRRQLSGGTALGRQRRRGT